MSNNPDQMMQEYINELLTKDGYHLAHFSTEKSLSTLIVRNLLQDGSPQYIEVRCLSRVEEYNIEIEIPIITDNKYHFYYFILFSPGMKKLWLLRADELIALRSIGLDDRDTSPYLVKNFQRLQRPELSLEEYKTQA